MNANVESAKAALLRGYSAEIRKRNPHLSFAQAWSLASSAHPELSEEYQNEAATAAAPVYRYTETVPSPVTSKLLPSRWKSLGAERVEAIEE